MEELYNLLESCCPTIDFRTEDKLVTNKVIDSMDLVSLISDIEDEFGISIEMDEIEPENFDSAEAMWELIQKLKG